MEYPKTIDDLYHADLPIIQMAEFEMLEAYNSVDNDNEHLYETAKQVINLNPHILEVLQADFDQADQEKFGDELDDESVTTSEFINQGEQLISFGEGLQQGYGFIIGLFTFVQMIRTNSNSVNELYENYRNAVGYIPVTEIGELERVSQVITGQAPIEKFGDFDINNPMDSRQYAQKHFTEFCEQAPLFKSLYEFEGKTTAAILEKQEEISEGELSEHMRGFALGAKNAVEMYFQTAEEKRFNKALLQ